MFFTGLCLASARVIVDPYHRKLILSYLAQWFGIVLPELDQGIIAQPLSTYLAESLNLELINIILQGITKFSTKDYDEGYKKKEKSLKIDYYKDKLRIR